MRSVNINTLALQKFVGVDIIEKVVLYKQYNQTITEVPTTTSVKVPGDATGLFAIDDVALLPLTEHETERNVTAVSYDSGSDTTTITLDGAAVLGVDEVGSSIAKKYDVTDRLVLDAVSTVDKSIEGGNLFEFDSGEVSITLKNEDEFFYNKEETGLFNNFDGIFWVKFSLKIKGSLDKWVTVFSGIVPDLTDTFPDPYNATFEIKAYGNTHELNRYPAYNVIDTSRADLPRIGGVTITRYEPSTNSTVGIKKVDYKPFDNTRLSGVTVERVSFGTTGGVKVLEFRYPHFFRWDNGDWVKIANLNDTINQEGTQKLFDYGGTEYAIVKFGDSTGLSEYPDAGAEVWVNIKDQDTDNVSQEVGNQGGPTIAFDNGLKVPIQMHFLAVVKDDGAYTDVTDVLNLPIDFDYTSSQIFDNDTDSLIIISDTRFWGMLFDLSEVFSAGDFDFYYSTGGTAFSSTPMSLATNGLVDETNNFTSTNNNPAVRWTKIQNWTKNTITVGTVDYKGYMIKIVRNSATGNCIAREVRRIIRAIGEDGDIVEFQFNQSLVTRENVNDEIIIKLGKDGEYAYGGWHASIPVSALLESALNEAFYYPSSRVLSDTKISLSEKTFNIWGKPPRYSYERTPTALAVDYTNQYVYVAVGLELWRCYFNGKWERLTEIVPYTGGAYPYTVADMWIENGVVYLDIQFAPETKMAVVSMVYSYNTATGVVQIETGSGFAVTNIMTGRKSIRHGKSFQTNSYYRSLGQYSMTTITPGGGASGLMGGENICVPFNQRLHVELNASSGTGGLDPVFLYDRGELTDILTDILVIGGSPITPNWVFADSNYVPAFNVNDRQGEIYVGDAGYYCMQSGNPVFNNHIGSANPMRQFELKIDYGQKGAMFRLSTGEYYGFKLAVDPALNEYYRLYDLANDNYGNIEFVNSATLPICAAVDEANNIVYFGHTSWIDDASPLYDGTYSYSYITRHLLSGNRVKNADSVLYYSGGGFSDITHAANNDLPLTSYPMNAPGTTMYIGSEKKFRTIKFYVPAGNYAIQYWDGTAWNNGLPNVTHPEFPNGIASFDIPHNWAKTTVNGTGPLYWVRVILASGSATVNTIGILEEVIFDGELDGGGNEIGQMPINLCLAGNTLHGAFFNRQPDLGTNPFQWSYFVIDLSTNTISLDVIAAENYTYDGTFIFKHHVYVANESAVYFIAENARFKDKPSELLKATYDSGTGEITIASIGTMDAQEWGAQTVITTDTAGHLFGITKDENYTMWEYADEFYPRIELAYFKESDSIRTVLQYINQMMNYYYLIHDDRTIRVANRGVTNGTARLAFNENVAGGSPKIGYWQHYYDATTVKYRNPHTNAEGDAKVGFDGWMKKILSIDNPLIQNKYIAKIIAQAQYEYYHRYRLAIGGLKLLPLFHLECIDSFRLLLNPRDVDLDSTKDFVITAARLNTDKSVEINGIEI